MFRSRAWNSASHAPLPAGAAFMPLERAPACVHPSEIPLCTCIRTRCDLKVAPRDACATLHGPGPHAGPTPASIVNRQSSIANPLGVDCSKIKQAGLQRPACFSTQLPQAEPPLRDQLALTSIWRGRVFSLLARCTRNTPSLNSALTLSGSASSGIEKLRSNRP